MFISLRNMRWIYVLLCENNYIYVGETSKLFTRLNQHWSLTGGCKHTKLNPPIKLIALYKMFINYNFIDYNTAIKTNFDADYCVKKLKFLDSDKFLEDKNNKDMGYYEALNVENSITELYSYYSENSDDEINDIADCCIRGGKYVKDDCTVSNNYDPDRPMCDCGLPCEIKYNKMNKKILYVCPKINIWNDLKMTKFCEYGEEDNCDYIGEYKAAENIREKLSTLEKKYRIYLQVSYEDKDEAKNLGAKWDSDYKLWYCPAKSELSEFKREILKNKYKKRLAKSLRNIHK